MGGISQGKKAKAGDENRSRTPVPPCSTPRPGSRFELHHGPGLGLAARCPAGGCPWRLAHGQAGGAQALRGHRLQPPHLHCGGRAGLRGPRLPLPPRPAGPNPLRLLQAQGPRASLLGWQCAGRLLRGAAGPPGLLPQQCGAGEPLSEARQGGRQDGPLGFLLPLMPAAASVPSISSPTRVAATVPSSRSTPRCPSPPLCSRSPINPSVPQAAGLVSPAASRSRGQHPRRRLQGGNSLAPPAGGWDTLAGQGEVVSAPVDRTPCQAGGRRASGSPPALALQTPAWRGPLLQVGVNPGALPHGLQLPQSPPAEMSLGS